MTCAICTKPEAPRVTLVDGRECCTWCEAWRHECEARAVLALPTLGQRRAYLYGQPNERGYIKGGIKGRRGEEAVRRLEATMMAIHGQRKAASSPCEPRRRFETQGQAQVAAHAIASREGQHRPPEVCSRCGGWHLAAANDNTKHTRQKMYG